VTEEMAFLGALFKFGMGFLHCDSNTRQGMATSHVAYKQSFGIQSYGHLDRSGGIQWPYRLEERLESNERRLFADGKFFTASGRARFLFAEPVSPPESPNADFPFWLSSGRGTSSQWHTQSRTAKSDVLALSRADLRRSESG
jgi:predicted molibdopterin-dependent oxidoreductase YjgC